MDRHPQCERQDQDLEQPADQMHPRVVHEPSRGMLRSTGRALEADKREGPQRETDDYPARHHPGDPDRGWRGRPHSTPARAGRLVAKTVATEPFGGME